MLKRFAAVILFLLPIHAYAQVGPGPVPYRGINNWNLIFGTDNTYDIGAVGASRPRNIYAGTAGFFPALTVSGLTATRCTFAGTGGLLSDDADCTFSGSRLTVTDFTSTNLPILSGGTAGRVLYFAASGQVANDAGLTYDGTTLESIDQTNISGPDSTTNVEIGSTGNDANAGTGGTSVCIGNSCSNASNGADNTLIGSAAAIATATATRNTVIGKSAAVTGASIRSVALGSNSAVQASFGTALGEATTVQAAGSIALGYLAVASTANTLVVGSDGSGAINAGFFGDGITSTTAPTFTFNATGGSGSDNAGGGLVLAAGRSTGSAAAADASLATGTAIASSSTAQTLVTRYQAEGSLRTLTDATATTVITVTTGNDLSCGGTMFFTVEAADAANQQATTGEVHFAAADNAAGAGGEACTAAITGTNVSAATSGTLTVTADATTGTDLCSIRLTATGSLTETVGPRVRYSIVFNPTSSSCGFTPQ